ncbi:hypothetical protein EXU29_18570 [Acinetobacter wuhouensis]|uniref:hypothetical protein n=1 Tax=Acinetobacter wuhouensis TaxID=1879050 RepID=UPI001023EAEC|nr:hypothetical protein [Acinetobacter wuhouensis]RZG66208.1 hypothetical protein EXU29_18570 [Acinetobacter wuhouensis]
MFNLENAIEYIEQSIEQLNHRDQSDRRDREQRIVGIVDFLTHQKLISFDQNMTYRKMTDDK